MTFRAIVLFIYVSLFYTASAQTNAKTHTFEQYIDNKQKLFSKKVTNLFDSVDQMLSNWVCNSDDNLSCAVFEKQNEVDEFFINEKFIYETQKSFIRIRLGSLVQTKDATSFNHKLRAQIPLQKTEKGFGIFIDDIKRNYFDETTPTINENEKGTEVGLSYFTPIKHNIKSRYSISISGLSAYATARYHRDFKIGKWLIQPTQQFRYSSKNDFSEETNIYIDRTLTDDSFLRTTLYRKTQSHIDGFDYRASFSYFLTPSKRKGFSLSQHFWGNSKYVCDEAPQRYNGISDYRTIVSWRQNIFRKWITYEIQPTVSFHRQYDYEPNYILRFFIDFYFGNID